ncbi:NAD(P)/FAD-dependent oxidoreductase [Psychrobacter sanguinis]|uniref:NAD(P)/FAD-dependent oxidoreductase n=1 Tax=Psychrobacter sanguinis TaxID=861445 RepID=UPI00020C79C9|nr:FAD-binding oxidoreductase [Psychrobacter sanguinis]EGK14378.1 oligoribonuclease Orn [Psychrobacter sp. 1501(2011)]MCD9150774.1 FAD-binding oxidoreductase [Psychrobacter sanguinis]
MQYDVIVIGSGMVGTSIAWHLQKNNSKVLVIDKKAPGEETSYGNAGLIQREAVYPKAFPREMGEIFRVLPNTSTDIRYRWSALFNYQSALYQYWTNSVPKKLTKIEDEWATLIEHCTSEHDVMIQASGADDLVRKGGWFEIYRTQKKYDEAIKLAERAATKGVQYKLLTPEELKEFEPNVNFEPFIGGIHWQNSWQVKNPSRLVKTYAKSFEAMQGEIKQAAVKNIAQMEDKSWQVTVETNEGETAVYTSTNVVIAAGPWSTELTRPLGYNFPLFPMRGYHQHFKVSEGNRIGHSLFDAEKGYLMGPMEQGIRITTGAEMTTLNAPKNFGQLEAVLKIAKDVLPLEEAVESEAWCGSRPCMADMKPVIGPAPRHEKLWFAFGHAHQGFTLGPATGRLVEEMINDKPLYIDATPFSAERFGH